MTDLEGVIDVPAVPFFAFYIDGKKVDLLVGGNPGLLCQKSKPLTASKLAMG